MKSIIIRYSLALLVAIFSSYLTIILLPWTLYSTYFFLDLFLDPILKDSTIILNGISFTIIPACTALLAYILLIELILFTRNISLKNSLKLFFLGSAMIFIMNLLRILILIFIHLNFGKNYFDAMHLIFWHIVSTLFIAFVWIFLIETYQIKSIPIYSDLKSL
jgi:exosortase/archaeosortase family protein